MINITVNNKPVQCINKITIQEVLLQMQIQTAGIAVAVNQEVISKDSWGTFNVSNNDTVLIIRATQGG